MTSATGGHKPPIFSLSQGFAVGAEGSSGARKRTGVFRVSAREKPEGDGSTDPAKRAENPLKQGVKRNDPCPFDTSPL